MYVLFCIQVTIDNLDIKNSIGTGLVMYNVAGSVTVSYSNITNSTPQTGEHVGAGGLHIEYTYCVPGKTECHIDDYSCSVPAIYS